ncbi:MAG: type II toxin-antitoxin system RelE/ParE family toxin [Candidatus Taylorbacteria bacterium]|nr:type II toxin-antitoxin system RelE/ParE family toxin [Candidatus Taylorbacteria bacterium]
MNNYEVQYYIDSSGRVPVREYIDALNLKEKAKVLKYIDFLRQNEGKLDEPYSRHIEGKIRELRVDFHRNRHRIFYFTFVGKKIVLLHAFLKKTAKTPIGEINQAKDNYLNIIK